MPANSHRFLPQKSSTIIARAAKLGVLVLAAIASNLALGAEFTIQVGAFKNPSQSFANDVRRFGEVNTAQNSKGMTVFTVGRYSAIEDAKADLGRVQAGYPGAYVRNMPSAARSPASAITSPITSANTAANKEKANSTKANATAPQTKATPEAALWETLTDAERRRVVYLDGVLHLKQGDDFVPLREYRRNQAQ